MLQISKFVVLAFNAILEQIDFNLFKGFSIYNFLLLVWLPII